MGCSDDREAPTEEEIQDMYDTEDIPPYITSNGSELNLSISILIFCLMVFKPANRRDGKW